VASHMRGDIVGRDLFGDMGQVSTLTFSHDGSLQTKPPRTQSVEVVDVHPELQHICC
jgi:hypothetical protein